MTRKLQTQRVRRIYTGGKKEEAALTGKLGFMGSSYEFLVGENVQPADLENYTRARAVYYRRFQDHPGSPMWRKFVPPLTPEAEKVYLGLLLKAIDKWRNENPKAVPVHPESAEWEPEWESVRYDADKLWPPRMEFMRAHKAELQAVPGLWDSLRQQVHRFMRDFYETIEYDD